MSTERAYVCERPCTSRHTVTRRKQSWRSWRQTTTPSFSVSDTPVVRAPALSSLSRPSLTSLPLQYHPRNSSRCARTHDRPIRRTPDMRHRLRVASRAPGDTYNTRTQRYRCYALHDRAARPPMASVGFNGRPSRSGRADRCKAGSSTGDAPTRRWAVDEMMEFCGRVMGTYRRVVDVLYATWLTFSHSCLS